MNKVFNTLGWHRIVLERSGDFGTVSVDNTVFFKNLPMIGSDNKVTISAFNDCSLTLKNFNLYLI